MMAGKNKAQVLTEACVLIAIFLAAAVAMMLYVKRAYQGYLKQNTDTLSTGEQFSAANSNFTRTVHSSAAIRDVVNFTGESSQQLLTDEVSRSEPFVDDFSGKKLSQEEIF